MSKIDVEHMLHLSSRKDGYSFARIPKDWGDVETRRALDFMGLVDKSNTKEGQHLAYVPFSRSQVLIFRSAMVSPMRITDARPSWLTHGVAIDRNAFSKRAEGDPFRIIDALSPIVDEASFARHFDLDTFVPLADRLEIANGRSQDTSGRDSEKLFNTALKVIRRKDEATLLNVVGTHDAVVSSIRELFIWLDKRERLACQFVSWGRFELLARELRCIGSPGRLQTEPLIVFDASGESLNPSQAPPDEPEDLYRRWIAKTCPTNQQRVSKYADQMKLVLARILGQESGSEAIELDDTLREETLAIAETLVRDRAKQRVEEAIRYAPLAEMAWQMHLEESPRSYYVDIAVNGPEMRLLLVPLCERMLAEGRLKEQAITVISTFVTEESPLLARLIVGRISVEKDRSRELSQVIENLSWEQFQSMLKNCSQKTLDQLKHDSVCDKLPVEYADKIRKRADRKRNKFIKNLVETFKKPFRGKPPYARGQSRARHESPPAKIATTSLHKSAIAEDSDGDSTQGDGDVRSRREATETREDAHAASKNVPQQETVSPPDISHARETAAILETRPEQETRREETVPPQKAIPTNNINHESAHVVIEPNAETDPLNSSSRGLGHKTRRPE